ncbi:tRNA pseudouridine(38-40) synthase TruA [Candidatus Babeliales bacterium]|nr:tRNA pseudouridine(38-40) synthase TruA [Candidatus Babeliales bacterium]
MKKFKIIISYDGTDFQGWQSQSHKRTISDCLQKTFEKIFSKKVSIIGASRTDSGVHALGQVATFKTDLDAFGDKIIRAWNNALPESILIKNIEEVGQEFHPLKNVIQKVYYYNLFLSEPLPFFARYGWLYELSGRVDWEKFGQALSLYQGTHDFRSFCKIDEEKNTVRTVNNIYVRKLKRFGILQVVIKGNSFLHFQIRRMIGYALDVARRSELSIQYIQELLDNPEPRQTLIKADGKGLVLGKIFYKR